MNRARKTAGMTRRSARPDVALDVSSSDRAMSGSLGAKDVHDDGVANVVDMIAHGEAGEFRIASHDGVDQLHMLVAAGPLPAADPLRVEQAGAAAQVSDCRGQQRVAGGVSDG